MRNRERILGSLESVYRQAFTRAEEAGDDDEMARLDFGFQRDQVFLEAVLDVRDALIDSGDEDAGKGASSLLNKAQALRNLARGRKP